MLDVMRDLIDAITNLAAATREQSAAFDAMAQAVRENTQALREAREGEEADLAGLFQQVAQQTAETAEAAGSLRKAADRFADAWERESRLAIEWPAEPGNIEKHFGTMEKEDFLDEHWQGSANTNISGRGMSTCGGTDV